MIKIKDLIVNENEIVYIGKFDEDNKLRVRTSKEVWFDIPNATFDDIEWNYGGVFEIMSEEEQLRQNSENDKDKILELRNDLIDKLQNQIKELEEENNKLKEEYITLEKDYGTCELENSKSRSEIIELKEEELRESKNIQDKIYKYKYLDRLSVTKISKLVNYTDRQVYRILKLINKNIRK